MKKTKQKWTEKSSKQKWFLISSCNGIVLAIIYSLNSFLSYQDKKLHNFYFIFFIFFATGCLLSFSYCLFEIHFETHNLIKKGVFEKIKKFIYLNCFLWLLYGLYLCIFPAVLNSLDSFIIRSLMFLCLLYLVAALAIWIYQLIYCVIFLKEYLLFKSTATVIIKILHSILISINGWFLILLNLFNFANLSKTISIIYVIISSSTILFYPSLDMFEYMSKEVDKFNKKKKKEKIENESNGSKNYTAW